MMDKQTLKHFILILLNDMKKKDILSYVKSMNTILKGSSGPVADLFKDSKAYGKEPLITLSLFNENMDELVNSAAVAKMTNSHGKIYYKKLTNAYISDRMALNNLFGISHYFNLESDPEINNNHYPHRSPTQSDVYSEKGMINVITVSGQSKSVEYESSIEKRLINELSEYEYINDIIEQPVELLKGKNEDRHYTPDLYIETYHNHHVIIEVKSLDEMTTHSVLKNYKLLEDYAYSKNMTPALVTFDSKRWLSLNEIKNMKTNILLETKILDKINKYGKVTDEEYKKIAQETDCDDVDIHHIILKNNLKKKSKWDKFYIEG